MSDAAREESRVLDVRFNEEGLVVGIVQDAESGQVLMVGWMNREALEQTLRSRRATFYSRSRGRLWVKGEESGHVQEVLEVRVDCDQDAVLLRCRSHGPCCHAGYRSCFYRAVEMKGEEGKGWELRFVEERVFDPAEVYGRKEEKK